MVKRLRSRAGQPDRHPPKRLTQKASPGESGSSIQVSVRVPAPPGPSADAVLLFQRGMQALQRHAYSDAARAFETVLDDFPFEAGVRERSQVYLDLCRRELRRSPATPVTVEERVTAATAALNNDDDVTAERLVTSVLADVPEHDLALYLLAVIQARRGESEAALEALEHAIAVSPEIRAQARHDADFEELRDLDAFRQILDSPVGANARRNRRSRSER